MSKDYFSQIKENCSLFIYDLERVACVPWMDFAGECFCFGSEAVNASGEAVRRLVKSRVESPRSIPFHPNMNLNLSLSIFTHPAMDASSTMLTF